LGELRADLATAMLAVNMTATGTVQALRERACPSPATAYREPNAGSDGFDASVVVSAFPSENKHYRE